MIGALRGSLVDKEPSCVVIDVHGVGYEVHVPLSTFYGLGELGSEIALRIHTQVREDVLALFGFATRLELELFERLIAISGVGPRLALAVLSGIEPPDLVRAVQAGDVVRLTRIPGVGKKTAERIGLELKDRLPPGLDIEADADQETRAEDDLKPDVLSALLNIGCHRPLAERAVDAAVKPGAGESSFEGVLRLALRELAR